MFHRVSYNKANFFIDSVLYDLILTAVCIMILSIFCLNSIWINLKELVRFVGFYFCYQTLAIKRRKQVSILS